MSNQDCAAQTTPTSQPCSDVSQVDRFQAQMAYAYAQCERSLRAANVSREGTIVVCSVTALALVKTAQDTALAERKLALQERKLALEEAKHSNERHFFCPWWS